MESESTPEGFGFDSTEGPQIATSKVSDPVEGPILSTADGREWVQVKHSELLYQLRGGQKYLDETAAAVPSEAETGGDE